jgi:hypothetical protein
MYNDCNRFAFWIHILCILFFEIIFIFKCNMFRFLKTLISGVLVMLHNTWLEKKLYRVGGITCPLSKVVPYQNALNIISQILISSLSNIHQNIWSVLVEFKSFTSFLHNSSTSLFERQTFCGILSRILVKLGCTSLAKVYYQVK